MGGDKSDVWQGTLALMVLKTLETLGPCTATASRGASSRPAATNCSSITAPCIPRC